MPNGFPSVQLWVKSTIHNGKTQKYWNILSVMVQLQIYCMADRYYWKTMQPFMTEMSMAMEVYRLTRQAVIHCLIGHYYTLRAQMYTTVFPCSQNTLLKLSFFHYF